MEMCSALRSQAWPSKRQPGAQAVAFAIEDQLGEELEAVHAALWLLACGSSRCW